MTIFYLFQQFDVGRQPRNQALNCFWVAKKRQCRERITREKEWQRKRERMRQRRQDEREEKMKDKIRENEKRRDNDKSTCGAEWSY